MKRTGGFTLIELLVVIAIAAIFISMVVGAVKKGCSGQTGTYNTPTYTEPIDSPYTNAAPTTTVPTAPEIDYTDVPEGQGV